MASRRSHVLNACRRQRSVHSTSNAYPPAATGAQRLSASKIGSRWSCLYYDLAVDVLNACRRQRSVHTNVRCGLVATGNVLNACRRQRSVHLLILCHFFGVPTCSTPVGVKDRFTNHRQMAIPPSLTCSTPVGVKDRFTVAMVDLPHMAARCSTPVGVKDRFTNPIASWCPLVRSAQRLSASKIGSLVPGVVCFSWPILVLNACRRQRSVHPAKGST